jgi:hypothetical protein
LAGIGNIVLVMNAIETTGIVDAQHQLRLDEPLPIAGQSRARMIVLVSEEADVSLIVNINGSKITALPKTTAPNTEASGKLSAHLVEKTRLPKS